MRVNFITEKNPNKEEMMRKLDYEAPMNEGKTGMDSQLGHIRGKVLDIDGNGVSRCRVWIRETGRGTCTDKDGNFVMINVAPAIYTLVAESEDHSLATLIDVPVITGDNPGFLFVMFPQYARSRRGRAQGALAYQL
jgi:hypothetical protein